MLFTGTFNTLSKKQQNDSKSMGVDGTTHDFHKPWFQTLAMFIGESLCLIAIAIQYYRKKDVDVKPLLVNENLEVKIPAKLGIKEMFLFSLPAACDLTGTTLAGIGLIYTYASVFQMLRGSIIIFTGVLTTIFLKRRLPRYKWFGIFVTTIGLSIVGYSNLTSSNMDSSKGNTAIFGIIFIVSGQFMNAIQFVMEEVLLKSKNFEPLQVVSFEGIWGTFLTAFVVLPIIQQIPGVDVGSYENTVDTLVMIKNSWLLCVSLSIYTLSIAFFNFFGMKITKVLTSVHRTFVDAVRTVCVWGVSLILYYATNHNFGEPWGANSYIQLIGFCFLILGAFVYNAVFKIPGFHYEDATQKLVNEIQKPLLAPPITEDESEVKEEEEVINPVDSKQ